MQHRIFDEKGESAGGPMYYIEKGLGLSWKPLAVFFAFCAVVCSFGSGNMNQANTVSLSASHTAGAPTWLSGVLMASVVGHGHHWRDQANRIGDLPPGPQPCSFSTRPARSSSS